MQRRERYSVVYQAQSSIKTEEIRNTPASNVISRAYVDCVRYAVELGLQECKDEDMDAYVPLISSLECDTHTHTLTDTNSTMHTKQKYLNSQHDEFTDCNLVSTTLAYLFSEEEIKVYLLLNKFRGESEERHKVEDVQVW